ncbi:MAG: diacylglycerol kinase family protein [Clostridia bacterium]|nr:diacylglycerol kinase family protein [Clostridia bacterium]
MKYYLYNPKAHSGAKFDFADDMNVVYGIGLNYQEFVDSMNDDDELVLVGGDGTINYFVNNVDVKNMKQKIYVMAGGTGNDFFYDIEGTFGNEEEITDLLKDLPTVELNGISRKFINGIGGGLDGYCCVEADRMRREDPKKKFNYTALALKGILGAYKPVKAKVIVDGKVSDFDHVWIIPVMKGRYYGGGMIISPDQDRRSDMLSLVAIHTRSIPGILAALLAVFKGEHVKYKKVVNIIYGKEIEVIFDRPCACQIDGETVYDVSSYKVHI